MNRLNLRMTFLVLGSVLLLLSGCAGHRATAVPAAENGYSVAVLVRTDQGTAGVPAQAQRAVVGEINNQLVRYGFAAVNTDATGLPELSGTAEGNLCQQYGVNAIILLDIAKGTLPAVPGVSCAVALRLATQGYDAAGRDLGISMSRTLTVNRSSCDQAAVTAGHEIGYEAGVLIASTLSGQGYGRVGCQIADTGTAWRSGIDERSMAWNESSVTVRLDNVRDPLTADAFSKIIRSAIGVVAVKRYGNFPGSIFWQVTLNGTDSFRLQAELLSMLRTVMDSRGLVIVNNVSYRYSPAEIRSLASIRPAALGSVEIHFTVDSVYARRYVPGAGPYPSGFD